LHFVEVPLHFVAKGFPVLDKAFLKSDKAIH
jgi:hypothetical protein